MGLYDRDYMRDDEPGWRPVRATPWSATIMLLVALIAVFVVQLAMSLKGDPSFEQTFALSLNGIFSGRIWQLFTFQFLHGNLLHIALNGFALYSFGRVVEQELGRARFLWLYFLSGIAGGLLQVASTLLLRQPADAHVVGASAGIAGLVGAFILSHPDARLLILPIPFPIRAWTLLWIILPLSVIGSIFPFGGIAHAAHLGGLLAGGAFIRWTWIMPRRPRSRPGGIVEIRRPTPPPLQNAPPDDDYIASEVDPILDKIATQGIHSLTERERRILESARKRMNKS